MALSTYYFKTVSFSKYKRLLARSWTMYDLVLMYTDLQTILFFQG